MSDLTIEGSIEWAEAREDGLHGGFHIDISEENAESFREVLADSTLTWDLEVVDET